MISETAICAQCGVPFRVRGLQGLCPACLAQMAFSIQEPQVPAGSRAAAGRPEPALRSKPCHFGDYELLEEIARGGAGVVYRARQVSLNRIVALKLLLFGRQHQPEFIRRFKAEAEATANLQHPNIVAIYEVGEHEGQHYFSMTYTDGQDLAHRAKAQPLPVELAVGYLRTIAEAVHYAHQRGVLHRDLKPSNILIDALDQPRITDFGLAKRLDGDSDLTLTGQVIGTPQYMSPEQARGRSGEVTVASDVYSLGAIFYFLLTRRPPFQAETMEGVLDQVLRAEPVPPRQLNPSVPRDLETICLKCLAKEGRGRYGTAQELADELGRFQRGEPILARRLKLREKTWRWCRRQPAFAALLVALHLVGATGLAGIVWQWQRANLHARRETAHRLRAETALTLLELQRAEDLLEKDETVTAVAYLARIVRQQPTNTIASRRLLAALTQRDFALPVGLALRHDKKVQHAEFSPDGRYVATASLDFTARIWDARTANPATPPIVHPEGVRAARFSPDGQRLLTFCDDYRARLWEVATGRTLGRPMEHAKRIRSAEFSPDGERIATASDDGTAGIWDGHTGEQVLKPLVHAAAVRSARFSRDSRRLLTASDDGTARIWDAVTGEPASQPLQHDRAVTSAEFSPDGEWIVTTAADFSSCVWNVGSGRRLASPLMHPAEIDIARFSPDGERILTALHDGTIRLWSPRDWKPLCQPMQQRGWVTSAEFSSDGTKILTGALDNTARLWNASNGEALTSPMQHDGIVWSAGLSRDGLAAVTASADQSARIWDVRFGAVRCHVMAHGGPVNAAEFSPDGRRVVTAAADHKVRIWDVRTGQQAGPSMLHGGSVAAVHFSPDGDLVASCTYRQEAHVWNVQTGEHLTLGQALPLKEMVTDLQFSPDGKWLATASLAGNIRLWNPRTGEPLGEPMRHRSQVSLIRFSPDGTRLLSADQKDDQVQIRAVPTGRLLAETPAREGTAAHGEFSPDGGRIVTASEDGTARIWDAHTGRQSVQTSMRHKGLVAWACFSPDGHEVATASEDCTAQVWSAETGQPISEPMRHRAEVHTVAFSPDGRLVVTASNDGTARLWDARTGRPLAEPWPHRDRVVSARFSPDGRRVLTACISGLACLWDVPPVLSTASDGEVALAGRLLADLAEAVVGKRLAAQGALESVSRKQLSEAPQMLRLLPQSADFTRWIAWFLADRSSRPLSPFSEPQTPLLNSTSGPRP